MTRNLRLLARPLLALLIPAAFAFARDEVTRDFREDVTLRPGQRVSLEHSHGDIEIRTHESAGVEIRATLRVSAPRREEAERFADAIEIIVDQISTDLLIRTRYPKRESAGWLENLFGGGNVSYSVAYEIAMPRNAPLRIRSKFSKVRHRRPGGRRRGEEFARRARVP